MTKVLIIYYCDNGYSCSCCGNDWRDIEVYETEETDLKAFVKKLEDTAKESYKKCDNYGRCEVCGAYVVTEEIVPY